MAKALGFVFVALLVLLALFANEMGWVDLKKRFASEEPYTPPPQIGWMWKWNVDHRGQRTFADITFFEVKSGGEVAVLGSGQCRWPCW